MQRYMINNMLESTSINPVGLTVPMVTETDGSIQRSMDIYSRLLRDRVINLDGPVNAQSASLIKAQLLFLDSEDSTEAITLYINSPGGSVTDGMAILDAMNLISAPVHTVSIGMSASMGAFLLSQGEPGHRYATPNAEIMVHQPLGGMQGQASDMKIHAERIERMKKRLTEMMAESTNGKTDVETMEKACDRDNFLTAEQALEMGLIDKILD